MIIVAAILDRRGLLGRCAMRGCPVEAAAAVGVTTEGESRAGTRLLLSKWN